MEITALKIIEQFVDTSLEQLIHPAYDFFYTEEENLLDDRFLDTSKPKQGNRVAWKAINSLIAVEEIQQLEREIGVSLPVSFRYYLQYKNFYELSNLTDVWMFCPLIPGQWSRKIRQAAFEGYDRKYLFDQGLLPFADCSDWGAVCFYFRNGLINGEYPIAIWDHERPNEWEQFADSFFDMCQTVLAEYKQINEIE